jgi:CRISPR/Cas system-associated protein Cas10 (large subunit of type III CRISPR-Cas system)
MDLLLQREKIKNEDELKSLFEKKKCSWCNNNKKIGNVFKDNNYLCGHCTNCGKINFLCVICFKQKEQQKITNFSIVMMKQKQNIVV